MSRANSPSTTRPGGAANSMLPSEAAASTAAQPSLRASTLPSFKDCNSKPSAASFSWAVASEGRSDFALDTVQKLYSDRTVQLTELIGNTPLLDLPRVGRTANGARVVAKAE